MDTVGVEPQAFTASRASFEQMVGWLDADAAELTHAELEEQLDARGRQLLRLLFQDHLDLRTYRERRLDETVVDDAGVARGAVEAGHTRTLTSIFGQVDVERMAYRRKRHTNLHPADAALNLPAGKHSHGLRRLAAIEATRGSFDQTVEAIERASGQQLGKRQLEQLAAAAAVDFEAFYTARQPPAGAADDVLVLSCDGKGIVMRPDALRPATAKAAKNSSNKLDARLSKGEKRNRKRMAEVGAVYDLTPVARSPAQVMARSDPTDDQPPPAPRASGKWLTASVVDDAAEVVTQIFDKADRRDPDHARTWVALVDGNIHQIDRIKAEAKQRDVEIRIVIDFVHVLEYLWAAAWSFFDEADPAAEAWVADKAMAVLEGNARQVAAGIRRRATRDRLDPRRRINADKEVVPGSVELGWGSSTRRLLDGRLRETTKSRGRTPHARFVHVHVRRPPPRPRPGPATGLKRLARAARAACRGDRRASRHLRRARQGRAARGLDRGRPSGDGTDDGGRSHRHRRTQGPPQPRSDPQPSRHRARLGHARRPAAAGGPASGTHRR